MFLKVKTVIQALRRRRATALLIDVLLVALLFLAITSWQKRDLLRPSTLEQAPTFQLTSLDGQSYELANFQGKPTLLYFFAPWCSVCSLSAHNLRQLHVKSEGKANIVLVAFSYGDRSAVAAYAERHELAMPILMDSSGEVAAAYRIQATPTYYVLDRDGRIRHRDVGYSTRLGLQMRLFLAARMS